MSSPQQRPAVAAAARMGPRAERVARYPQLDALTAIRQRLGSAIRRTPLIEAPWLGRQLGCSLHFKAELLQHTGSYKPRGILNRLLALSPEERARGVITVSAGNAAIGLAYAAAQAGSKAVTVMPEGASAYKAQAAREYGAEVILHGRTAPDAFAFAKALAQREGYVWVAPSDDPDVTAGHASIGLEILEDAPDTDLILVPVGAGGLGAGVAIGVAAAGSRARVVGVEPHGACTMWMSLQAGAPTDLPGPPDTVADGLAYPFGGRHTYPVFRDLAERVVLVSDAQIVEAMWTTITRTKLCVEPSGAAGLAGLMAHASALAPYAKVVCVLSGGNIEPRRLASLAPPDTK